MSVEDQSMQTPFDLISTVEIQRAVIGIASAEFYDEFKCERAAPPEFADFSRPKVVVKHTVRTDSLVKYQTRIEFVQAFVFEFGSVESSIPLRRYYRFTLQMFQVEEASLPCGPVILSLDAVCDNNVPWEPPRFARSLHIFRDEDLLNCTLSPPTDNRCLK